MAMERAILVAMCFFALNLAAFSQRSPSLTGPAAKNYKPWKDQTGGTVLKTAKNRQRIMGPAAKNYKPKKDPQPVEMIPVTSRSNMQLAGPRSKHYALRRPSTLRPTEERRRRRARIILPFRW